MTPDDQTKPERSVTTAILTVFLLVFVAICISAVMSGLAARRPDPDQPIRIRSIPVIQKPSAIAAGAASVTSRPADIDVRPIPTVAPSAVIAPPGHSDLRYQIEEGWSLSPYSRVKTVSVSKGEVE